MKKILVLLVLLPLLMAQQIVYYDVVPITWDAVAPIAGSTITYEVIRVPAGAPGSLEIVAEISGVEYDIPLVVEGDWIVGVRTVRTIDSNNERYLSPVNWSDVNGVWTLDPFVVRYYIVPPMPTGLRLQ